MASHRAPLSGNTSLIATFSTVVLIIVLNGLHNSTSECAMIKCLQVDSCCRGTECRRRIGRINCFLDVHVLQICCCQRSHYYRPPDIVVGSLRFYRDSFSPFSISSCFISCCPSSLKGTVPKPATCSEVSAVWKYMTKVWGIPSP